MPSDKMHLSEIFINVRLLEYYFPSRPKAKKSRCMCIVQGVMEKEGGKMAKQTELLLFVQEEAVAPAFACSAHIPVSTMPCLCL